MATNSTSSHYILHPPRIICVIVWVASWTSRLFTKTIFTWKTNHGYWDGCLAEIFAKSKSREPVISRNTTDSGITNDEIQAYKWKIKILENWICDYELDIFLILKDFPNEIDGDITSVVFWCCIMKCVNIWNICVTQ